MVQSKKKQKKNADFAKVKLKVGKGKVGPSNATPIDIQSRTLIVPGQSLAATDKDQALKTKRNLTLKELLAHLKHHNAHVRKDAILGIQELVDAHPTVLLLHLGSIMQALIQTMLDDDPHVRSALLAAVTHLASMLETHHAAPLTPSFVVYLSSAMNHINNDIRIDALQFMTPWLDRFPKLLCPYAAEILADFAGMLDAATLVSQGNAGTRLASPKVRAKVFYALAKYLHVLLEHRTAVPLGSAASAAMPVAAPSHTIWAPATPLAPFPLFGVPASTSASAAASTAKPDFGLHSNASVLALLDAVTPALLAFWMDAAPAAFAKPVVGSSDALQLCTETVRVVAVLLRFFRGTSHELPKAWANAFDARLVRHLLQWFPFAAGKQVTDAPAKVAVAVMTVHLAEIVARVREGGAAAPEHDDDDDEMDVDEDDGAQSIKSVVLAVTKVFAPPAKQAKGNAPAAKAPVSPLAAVTPDQFASDLVPSIHVLLDLAPNVLAPAVLTWAQALPASHGTRMAATRYLCDKLLTLSSTLDTSTTTRPFLLSLVRYVYELRTSSLDTSLAIFHYLRTSLAAGTALGPQLTSGLAVYFYLPGKSGSPGTFGPWIHASPALQRLVLDTAYYLPGESWSERLVSALVRCLCVPMMDQDVVLHALSLLRLRTPASTFRSALFSVSLGSPVVDATRAGALDVAAWHAERTLARGVSKKRKSSSSSSGDTYDDVDPVHAMVDAHRALVLALHARFPHDPSDAAGAFAEVAVVPGDVPTLVSVAVAQWVLSTCALEAAAMARVANVVVQVERAVAASDAPARHPLTAWVGEVVAGARKVYPAEAWEQAVVLARNGVEGE